MTDLPTEDNIRFAGDLPTGTAPNAWADGAAPGTASWFHALLHHSRDLITVVGADGRVRYQSPNLERLLGFRPGELAGTHLFALAHPEDQAAIEQLIEVLTVRSHTLAPMRFRVRHRDGSWRWLEVVAGNALTDTDVGGTVINARDITERAEHERQLHHRAFHDPLTGLPNRALFGDRLNLALRRAKRHGEHVAVLFVDLDHFKAINDTMGHETGDQVLVSVGARLASALSDAATIARVGGEEFAILLERASPGEALDLAHRLIADLRRPVALAGHDVTVSVSIGLAVSGADLALAEDLMRAADIAHYQAKANGRGTAVLLEPPMYRAAMARLAMKFDLQPAIEQGQLCLVYQPVVELGSRRIVGVEALVRWRRPGFGLVAPGEFIPLAEEAGLILALDDWVLRQACQQTQIWATQSAGGPSLDVHVNVSTHQLRQPGAADRIAASLASSGLPARRLVLELRAETLAFPESSVESLLASIRELGVRIAIDDFGGPRSSLGALRSGVFDLLNLDRAIVRGLATDAADRAVAASIVGLARALGVEVTAEGIETAGQARAAWAMGCQWGQGFLFAPPLPAPEMGALLTDEHPARFRQTLLQRNQPAPHSPWDPPSAPVERQPPSRAAG